MQNVNVSVRDIFPDDDEIYLVLIKNLETRLRAKYGNPLTNYKKTQDDVHMTYYVGRLMEEQGHEYVIPKDKDCAYYSEKAMHDAFLAGRLISKADKKEMRAEIIAELKAEMHDAIDNINIKAF
jgi:hypothetical protein